MDSPQPEQGMNSDEKNIRTSVSQKFPHEERINDLVENQGRAYV